MKTIIALFLLATQLLPAATTFTESWTIPGGMGEVGDNDELGWSDSRTITTTLTEIVSVQVHLEISGTYNGDLYAYLIHDTGISILLNRIGRSTLIPDGSPLNGMDVTFSDSADEEIHTYSGSLFSGEMILGTYRPDARSIDPADSLDTTPRDVNSMLSAFTGLDPNGEWTLFVADLSPGEQSSVTSWGLTISAVPEPVSATVGIPFLILSGLLMRRCRPRPPCP